MKKIFLGLLFLLLSQSLHARYFDPEGGRFINRDPLEYVDGMNLYAGYFAQRFKMDPSGTVTRPPAPEKEDVINNEARWFHPFQRGQRVPKPWANDPDCEYISVDRDASELDVDFLTLTTSYKNFKLIKFTDLGNSPIEGVPGIINPYTYVPPAERTWYEAKYKATLKHKFTWAYRLKLVLDFGFVAEEHLCKCQEKYGNNQGYLMYRGVINKFKEEKVNEINYFQGFKGLGADQAVEDIYYDDPDVSDAILDFNQLQ